jgi:hypothetical protein
VRPAILATKFWPYLPLTDSVCFFFFVFFFSFWRLPLLFLYMRIRRLALISTTGVNLKSQFHTSNVTAYQEDEPAPEDTGKPEKSAALLGVATEKCGRANQWPEKSPCRVTLPPLA